MAKRCLDIILSALGLLLLGPLMVILAICVRLDSPGPAWFRQTRIARGGRPFQILKFRSMTMRSEGQGALVTAAGDARVTAVGAFLRRTKLDELPQLINVLRGDMSLVGPRPEVPRYVELYPEELRGIILSVKPGITDEASIQFRDESELLAGSHDVEATYVQQILPRKLEIYVRYAREHTFMGDLRILGRTVKLLLKG